MTTDFQVIALMKEYKKSHNIKLSSLKVGMNRKTAAKYLKLKKLPSEMNGDRSWRTHPDRLEKIWEYAYPFLENDPDIEIKALFEHLLDTHPDIIAPNQLRSFQRKVKLWRVKNGSEKEVYFDQVAIPGEMAQVDWVDLNRLNIFIEGAHYKHKLIHFALNYSNVESATICRSESIHSIKNGLRDFLYRVLLKAPKILQIDNSSAATHTRDRKSSDRVFNDEFLEVLKYYGIKPQKNNVRKPNENGVVESLNGHIKKRITQALKIRGNQKFDSLDEYKKFLETIIDKINKRRQSRFDEELKFLKNIPQTPLPNYQEQYVTVRNRSLLYIKGTTYSVPSRLIGTKLKAKIYDDRIDLCSGSTVVQTLPKRKGRGNSVIDYRHLINSLIRKPAAFSNYKYKSELYPTENFKRAYEQLVLQSGYENRNVNIAYLRILKLAADNIEEDVDIALGLILSSKDQKLSIDTVSDLILSNTKHKIDPISLTPNLNSYDDLFSKEEDIKNERAVT